MTRREERQQLYNTERWKNMSLILRSQHPMCEKCGERPSMHCHHIKSPFDIGISRSEALYRMYDEENIICLCAECHQAIHEEQEKAKKQWREDEKNRFYIRY